MGKRMSSTRMPGAVAVLGLTAILTAACGTAPETTAEPTPDPGQGTATAPTRHTPSHPVKEEMKIEITLGDKRFGAVLEESAASRDLLRQLPVTVDMVDHGGVEKTGPLPSPLSLDGQPDGADPDVGAVGYYAPGNDLVLYYGDQSYFPGIVVLGRLDDGVAEQLADVRGAVTVTVEEA